MQLRKCATWETIVVVAATRSDLIMPHTTPIQLERESRCETRFSPRRVVQLLYKPQTKRSSHTRTSPRKTPFGSNQWRACPNPSHAPASFLDRMVRWKLGRS